jgi:hypothetical protein
MTPGVRLFIWLLVAHCLCDYPLQGDFLSRAKRRGGVTGVPWYQALAAHATIHAGAVLLITGSMVLFVAELVAHAAIDYWKCAKGAFGTVEQEQAYDVDQLMHWSCKALWVLGLAMECA